MAKGKWTSRKGVGRFEITDKDGKWVASCDSEANANLIVQTHNSFEGLLKACKRAVKILPSSIGDSFDYIDLKTLRILAIKATTKAKRN